MNMKFHLMISEMIVLILVWKVRRFDYLASLNTVFYFNISELKVNAISVPTVNGALRIFFLLHIKVQ